MTTDKNNKDFWLDVSEIFKNFESKSNEPKFHYELLKTLIPTLKQGVQSNFESERAIFPPFLPPKRSSRKYTLVLDLDETLVHYVDDEEDAFILIRPGAEDFINELSDLYEIVIFTAATQEVSSL